MNNTPKVLVIDDEVMIQIILNRLISSYGFIPIQALTGDAALQQLKQHTPEIILLDIMMPDCDSMALLQSIKADPKLKHTRVIMVSGSPNHDLIASYVHAGADDYVLKPFHAILLQSRLLHALERLQIEQSNELIQNILSEVASKLRKIAKENETSDNNISHEMHHCLTGVLSCTQILEENGGVNDE